MKQILYKPTPVSEGLPKETGQAVFIDSRGRKHVIYYSPVSSDAEYFKKEYSHVLSPVSVVMPESVSDDALTKKYTVEASPISGAHVNAYAFCAARWMRDTLIPAFAQQQERINKLEDEAVGLIEAGTIQAERIKELEEAVEAQRKYIELLGEELNETVPLAASRNWKSTRHEAGVKLRETISALTTKPHTAEEGEGK